MRENSDANISSDNDTNTNSGQLSDGHGTPSRKHLFSRSRDAIAENTKDMTGKEKAKYLFYYYKWYLLVAVVLILLAIYVCINVAKSSKPIAFSYAILNSWVISDSDDSLHTYIFEDYADSVGKSVSNGYQIISDTMYTFSMEDHDENSTMNGYYVRFNAMTEDDYYDVIITDEAGLQFCALEGTPHSPDTVLSDETMSLYSDRLVYMDVYDPYDPDAYISDEELEQQTRANIVDADADNAALVAIDVSDSKFIQELNLYYDTVYIIFPGTSDDNKSRADSFIQYIYNYN